MASSLMVQGAMRTYPWPALRFLEITESADSDHYRAICDENWDTARQCAEDEALPPADPSEINVDDIVEQAKDAGRMAKDMFRSRFGKR